MAHASSPVSGNRSDISSENKEYEDNQSLNHQVQIIETLIESEEKEIIQLQDQINKVNRQLSHLDREVSVCKVLLQNKGISVEEKSAPESLEIPLATTYKVLIRQQGFVQYALNEQGQCGLKRWYLELLSMKEEGMPCGKPDVDTLNEDVPFFNLFYAQGDPVDSNKKHEVRELLCFSSKRAGHVRRICCMKMRTGDYCIETDHYSRDFEATATRILTEHGEVCLLLDALWHAS